MLPNLWSLIEADVFAKKLVPRLPFDHQYFEVMKVDGTTLYCRFSGTSARDQKEIEQSFLVVAKIGKDGVSLSLKP